MVFLDNMAKVLGRSGSSGAQSSSASSGSTVLDTAKHFLNIKGAGAFDFAGKLRDAISMFASGKSAKSPAEEFQVLNSMFKIIKVDIDGSKNKDAGAELSQIIGQGISLARQAMDIASPTRGNITTNDTASLEKDANDLVKNLEKYIAACSNVNASSSEQSNGSDHGSSGVGGTERFKVRATSTVSLTLIKTRLCILRLSLKFILEIQIQNFTSCTAPLKLCF